MVASLLLGVLAGSAEAATLTVELVELQVPKGGDAIIAVFDREDAWLDLPAARARVVQPVSGDTLTARFEGLPAGRYAVSVIHDEDGDGELDMRWLPFPGPVEGAGVSNDAPASFGPPSFGDAVFSLPAEGRTIRVTVRY
ncbi:MAG: DUF2141 domain-containing protein [Alphaproteobacteria bacterium]|nr:DUF2141 domain-containing protein [Alphaproteobacteria bacterium]